MNIDIDFNILILPFICGVFLSAFYMGMLYLSLKNMASSPSPIKTLLTGALMRLAAVGCVFYYFVSSGRHWSEMTACLVGFVITRMVLLSKIAKSANAAKSSEAVVEDKLEIS
ncbi:MAG: hypothetical protein GY804_05490 [Alphaproteobacteria bacterium]|nr:hypothetical protein [Alphaproteobacteria bacterium]